MGIDDAKRMAESLDPSQYAAHVVRTSLLLEQLALDVKALRDQNRIIESDLNKTREDTVRAQGSYVSDRDYRREHTELTLLCQALKGEISSNKEDIAKLSATLGWLTKLVIGAVLTGLIGGGMSFLLKLHG